MSKSRLFIASVCTMMLSVGSVQAFCLIDSVGYEWNVDIVETTATATYLSGTMTNSSGTFGAGVTANGNAIAFSSDFGTGFHYNLKFVRGVGSGPWINSDGGGGRGTITSMTFCAAAASAERSDGGAKPGE